MHRGNIDVGCCCFYLVLLFSVLVPFPLCCSGTALHQGINEPGSRHWIVAGGIHNGQDLSQRLSTGRILQCSTCVYVYAEYLQRGPCTLVVYKTARFLCLDIGLEDSHCCCCWQ